MNTERILRLADTIERFGDEHFTMSLVSNPHFERYGPTFCGSVACVCGWAGWLKVQETGQALDGPPSFSEVSEWLGFSADPTPQFFRRYPLAIELFTPYGWRENYDANGRPYTAKRAATVLRHLAATGQVNWNADLAAELPQPKGAL